MKVFIGGSRKITRLNADIQHRLDRIIEKSLPILVGDANGADKAVQRYLASKRYNLVEVFCAGGECRNNLGHWPIRSISSSNKQRNFDFYASKDRAMANEATYGLMIWDGRSVGTLMNALRLIEQGKMAAVYVGLKKQFIDVKNWNDWELFVTNNASEMRRRLQEQVETEKNGAPSHRQTSMF
jgi:hypothetical protein